MPVRITLPFLVVPVGIGQYHNGNWCYDQFDVVVGGDVVLPTVDVTVNGGNLDLSDEQRGRISDRLHTIASDELLTAILRETVRCQEVRSTENQDPESTVKGK